MSGDIWCREDGDILRLELAVDSICEMLQAQPLWSNNSIGLRDEKYEKEITWVNLKQYPFWLFPDVHLQLVW